MAERQQKLLANRIAGTPRLSEQAIDDEQPRLRRRMSNSRTGIHGFKSR